MFMLKPKGAAKGSGQSQTRTNIAFFGKLGFYFGAIRAAFLFFGAGDESTKTLQN